MKNTMIGCLIITLNISQVKVNPGYIYIYIYIFFVFHIFTLGRFIGSIQYLVSLMTFDFDALSKLVIQIPPENV